MNVETPLSSKCFSAMLKKKKIIPTIKNGRKCRPIMVYIYLLFRQSNEKKFLQSRDVDPDPDGSRPR